MGRIKANRTIIVITHEMNAAADQADLCVVLHEGRVVNCISVEQLKSRAENHLKIQARSNFTLEGKMDRSEFKRSRLEQTISRTDFYQEYRLLRSQISQLTLILDQHQDDTIVFQSVTLDDEIVEIIRHDGEKQPKHETDELQHFLRH